MTEHRMDIDEAHPGEYLLVCPDCDRRLVLKDSGEMVVIDQGDFFALHSASSAPVEFEIEVGP